MRPRKKESAIMRELAPWLDHLTRRGLSRSTISNYQHSLQNLARFLKTRKKSAFKSVSTDDLSAWQQSMVTSGLCPGSVDLFTRCVRGYFAWCVETGRLFSNPAINLPLPRFQRPLGSCPTEVEMHRWLESMDGKSPIALRDRALVEVAYATGARLHELEKLDLGSLDTAYGFCRLWGKGSKERMVPLTTQALRALQVYLKKGRPVLLRGREGITALWIGNRQGSPLKAQALAYLVTRRAAKAGLTLTTHTIRRAFATHLLRGGAHIVHIKDMLGHTRYRHLRHYLRLSASDVSDTLRKSKPGRR